MNLKSLLRLLTENEKQNFKLAQGLKADAKDSDLLKAIRHKPKYDIVRFFIQAANPTLIMLQEIFKILEIFNISTRTTKCIFMLSNPSNIEQPTELIFTQQSIEAICQWSDKKQINANGINSPTQLLEDWKNFRSIWKRLLQQANPNKRSRRIDPVKSIIRGQTLYKKDSYHFDEKAYSVLSHFGNSIDRLLLELKKIPTTIIPNELTLILDDVQKLHNAITMQKKNLPRELHLQLKQSKKLESTTIQKYTTKLFPNDFDKYLENIYELSNLIQGEGLANMIQLNIWSSRPQLFEIWILLKLLEWFQNNGYEIEILKKTERKQQSIFQWNLSYTKDQEPCASISNPIKNSKHYLFYQLYIPGDMPDISLLKGPKSSDIPIWAVDPKHSEKGGYSLSAYRNTAIRYHKHFGANIALILEYFDREDLGSVNPIEFIKNAKLIRGCSPFGSGMKIFFKELSSYHPRINTTLICIDCSSSFKNKRDEILTKLHSKYQTGDIGQSTNECICFANNAIELNNFNYWLENDYEPFKLPIGLDDGTQSKALIDAIINYRKKQPINVILIISDGIFEITLDNVISQIENQTNIKPKIIFQEIVE